MVPNSDLWKMTEAKAGAMGAGYYEYENESDV